MTTRRIIDPHACPRCKRYALEFVTPELIEKVAAVFDTLSVEKHAKCIKLFGDGEMAILYCPSCGYFESLFPLRGAESWYQTFKDEVLS